MTVYVEVFRNIPVLLWIVAFVAVYIEILPSPREFKGADATAAMLFGDIGCPDESRAVYPYASVSGW